MNLDVLFVGAVCIDYIASVNSFPTEDAKVRSNYHLVAGGGNAANSACASSKLGVSSALLSKIGRDAAGDVMLQQLTESGVDTRFVLKSAAATAASAFTYVLVSEATQTRTCIHTPADESLTPADIDMLLENSEQQQQLLQRFRIIHFDSRHTEAAAHLAARLSSWNNSKYKASSKRNADSVESSLPLQLLTIDVEKQRPHLFQLLPHCHIIFTNQHAPQQLVPCERHLDSVLSFFDQQWASSCLCVVSTLGSTGSLLVRERVQQPQKQQQQPQQRAALCYWLEQLSNDIFFNINLPVSVQQIFSADGREFELITCGACNVPPQRIVDSTGAGDCYIGVFLYALLKGCPLSDCMKAATVAVAQKLNALGAREGQPVSEEELLALAGANVAAAAITTDVLAASTNTATVDAATTITASTTTDVDVTTAAITPSRT